MEKMQLLAMVQAYTSLGIGLMIGLGALGACLGVGNMCSHFLEGAARQPELMPKLQTKVFLSPNDRIGEADPAWQSSPPPTPLL